MRQIVNLITCLIVFTTVFFFSNSLHAGNFAPWEPTCELKRVKAFTPFEIRYLEYDSCDETVPVFPEYAWKECVVGHTYSDGVLDLNTALRAAAGPTGCITGGEFRREARIGEDGVMLQYENDDADRDEQGGTTQSREFSDGTLRYIDGRFWEVIEIEWGNGPDEILNNPYDLRCNGWKMKQWVRCEDDNSTHGNSTLCEDPEYRSIDKDYVLDEWKRNYGVIAQEEFDKKHPCARSEATCPEDPTHHMVRYGLVDYDSPYTEVYGDDATYGVLCSEFNEDAFPNEYPWYEPHTEVFRMRREGWFFVKLKTIRLASDQELSGAINVTTSSPSTDILPKWEKSFPFWDDSNLNEYTGINQITLLGDGKSIIRNYSRTYPVWIFNSSPHTLHIDGVTFESRVEDVSVPVASAVRPLTIINSIFKNLSQPLNPGNFWVISGNKFESCGLGGCIKLGQGANLAYTDDEDAEGERKYEWIKNINGIQDAYNLLSKLSDENYANCMDFGDIADYIDSGPCPGQMSHVEGHSWSTPSEDHQYNKEASDRYTAICGECEHRPDRRACVEKALADICTNQQRQIDGAHFATFLKEALTSLYGTYAVEQAEGGNAIANNEFHADKAVVVHDVTSNNVITNNKYYTADLKDILVSNRSPSPVVGYNSFLMQVGYRPDIDDAGFGRYHLLRFGLDEYVDAVEFFGKSADNRYYERRYRVCVKNDEIGSSGCDAYFYQSDNAEAGSYELYLDREGLSVLTADNLYMRTVEESWLRRLPSTGGLNWIFRHNFSFSDPGKFLVVNFGTVDNTQWNTDFEDYKSTIKAELDQQSDASYKIFVARLCHQTVCEQGSNDYDECMSGCVEDADDFTTIAGDYCTNYVCSGENDEVKREECIESCVVDEECSLLSYSGQDISEIDICNSFSIEEEELWSGYEDNSEKKRWWNNTIRESYEACKAVVCADEPDSVECTGIDFFEGVDYEAPEREVIACILVTTCARWDIDQPYVKWELSSIKPLVDNVMRPESDPVTFYNAEERCRGVSLDDIEAYVGSDLPDGATTGANGLRTSSCSDDSIADSMKGACSQVECDEGYHAEDHRCIASSCDQNYHLNWEAGECEECADDSQQSQGNIRECVPVACNFEREMVVDHRCQEARCDWCKQTFDQESGQCVDIVCSDGEELNDCECQAVGADDECDPGFTKVDGACVTDGGGCSAPMVMIDGECGFPVEECDGRLEDGVCVTAATDGCPDGQVKDENDECVAEIGGDVVVAGKGGGCSLTSSGSQSNKLSIIFFLVSLPLLLYRRFHFAY